jgi:hypothetical protein
LGKSLGSRILDLKQQGSHMHKMKINRTLDMAGQNKNITCEES